MKRVSIVNELLSDPQLLILDEPMTGLVALMYSYSSLPPADGH